MPSFEVAGFDLSALADDDLVDLAAAAATEQHRRALGAGDPQALIEEAFDTAFGSGSRPTAALPYLAGQVLVCPGLLVERSRSSHDCVFVSVKHAFDESGVWSWEAADLIDDQVRVVPEPRRVQRSVTLIAATQGLEVDVVTSKARQGQHTMSKVVSMLVDRGELSHVTTRARKPRAGHR